MSENDTRKIVSPQAHLFARLASREIGERKANRAVPSRCEPKSTCASVTADVSPQIETMDRSVTSWAKYRAWQTVWFIYWQTEAEECCWVTLGKAVAAQTDAVPREIGDGYNHSPICPITFGSPLVANARGLLKVAVLSSRAGFPSG